jgi:hypothetical protein
MAISKNIQLALLITTACCLQQSLTYKWLDAVLLNQCHRCLTNNATTYWVRAPSTEDTIQPGICLLHNEISKMENREMNGSYFCHPFDCLDPYDDAVYMLHQLKCTEGTSNFI